MNDNTLFQAHHVKDLLKENVWKSCQMFGGHDKRSLLGAIYCDLDCQNISTDDRLLLCQVGRGCSGEPAINYLEIRREDTSLIFETYIGATGKLRDTIRRPSSHKNIKLSIKPETDRHGSYTRVHFIVYDADDPDIYDAMFSRTYGVPGPQSIDRIAVMLKSCCTSEDYRPSGVPAGVNNLRSYGIGETPEILKPNFEWYGEEIPCKGGYHIVSRHYEGYKLNTLANVKQWKEKI